MVYGIAQEGLVIKLIIEVTTKDQTNVASFNSDGFVQYR